ncbi:hypothetical protein J4230_01250 [Candidatus Woesearchaeota archaeon]|nr:hypothetical protein [Candidatus Woesearchaeota archaeon]
MLAKNVRDLDSIILKDTSPTSALRKNIGSYLFYMYTRDVNEGLIPREASLAFAYNSNGLNFNVFLDTEIVTTGSIEIPNEEIVKLLSRKDFTLEYETLTDKPEKLRIKKINGRDVFPNSREFKIDDLAPLGEGVFLTNDLIDLIKQASRSSDNIEIKKSEKRKIEAAFNTSLGYYSISPGDDLSVKAAKFLANLKIEGLYEDNKLVFNEKKYSLDHMITAVEGKEAIGVSINGRDAEIRKVVDLEKKRGLFHPIVVLYHIRIPEGRSYSKKEDIMKALYLDDLGLEAMIKQGKIKKYGSGIKKLAIMEQQIKLYHDIWEWLASNNYDVPVIGQITEPTQVQEVVVDLNRNKLILADKNFSSIASIVSNDIYSMPVAIAGKYGFPKLTTARLLLKRDHAEIYTQNGLVGTFRISREKLDHYGILQVSYIPSHITSTINIGDIIGINKISGEELLVSAAQRFGDRESRTLVEGSDRSNIVTEDLAAVPEEYKKKQITGRSNICRSLGIGDADLAKKREELIGKKLLYRGDDGSLYVLESDIPELKKYFGISELVKIASAPVKSILPERKEERTEIPRNEKKQIYDIHKHVKVGTIAYDFSAFYTGDNDNPHKVAFGVIARNFIRLLKQYDEEKDRDLIFVEKKDVGKIAEIFNGRIGFDISDKLSQGIFAFYSLPSIEKINVTKNHIKIDFVLGNQGLHESNKDFYFARYHLALTLKDKIKLDGSMYPVIEKSHEAELYTEISKYLGKEILPIRENRGIKERSRNHNGKIEYRNAKENIIINGKEDIKTEIENGRRLDQNPGKKPITTQPNYTAAILQGIEAMVLGEKFYLGMSKRAFGGVLEKDYGTGLNNYVNGLHRYAEEVWGIKETERDKTEDIEVAVREIKDELKLDEESALRVLTDELKIKDSVVPRTNLMIYIARVKYIMSNNAIIV